MNLLFLITSRRDTGVAREEHLRGKNIKKFCRLLVRLFGCLNYLKLHHITINVIESLMMKILEYIFEYYIYNMIFTALLDRLVSYVKSYKT